MARHPYYLHWGSTGTEIFCQHIEFKGFLIANRLASIIKQSADYQGNTRHSGNSLLLEGAIIKNAPRRFLALLRQLFKDDRPKVSRRGDRATLWRIAPPAQQTSDNPLGDIDGDADFIRIYPSRRR